MTRWTDPVLTVSRYGRLEKTGDVRGEVAAVEDPTATFYMACGWHRGYFGMQVNSPTESRTIFSVWDSGNEAVDRRKVPEENRSLDATGKADRLDGYMGVEEGQSFLSHGGFVEGFARCGERFTRPASWKAASDIVFPALPIEWRRGEPFPPAAGPEAEGPCRGSNPHGIMTSVAPGGYSWSRRARALRSRVGPETQRVSRKLRLRPRPKPLR